MPLVDYEVKEKIAYITMNRPEKVNAINLEMVFDFVAAIDSFAEDPGALVAIVSGRGKGFCAGADLSSENDEFIIKAEQIYTGLRNLDKPTIAAVHGVAAAQGIGIALCCDIRLAAEGARFGWPNVTHGFCSIGGIGMAPHILPKNIACEYLLTGDLFGAEEALRYHIVNRVAPMEELMKRAEEMAGKIRANAPLAVKATKRGIRSGLEMGYRQRIDFAKMIFSELRRTRDAQEGIDAFLQKREPVWKGK
jgi:enoyl-CoA hydratase/carnithine racemase